MPPKKKYPKDEAAVAQEELEATMGEDDGAEETEEPSPVPPADEKPKPPARPKLPDGVVKEIKKELGDIQSKILSNAADRAVLVDKGQSVKDLDSARELLYQRKRELEARLRFQR